MFKHVLTWKVHVEIKAMDIHTLLSYICPWNKILSANSWSLTSYHFTQVGKHNYSMTHTYANNNFHTFTYIYVHRNFINIDLQNSHMQYVCIQICTHVIFIYMYIYMHQHMNAWSHKHVPYDSISDHTNHCHSYFISIYNK